MSHLDDWNTIHKSKFWTFLEKETWFSVLPSHRRGGAGCLIVDQLGQVLLLRVRRRALGEVRLEIPRGGCDAFETAYEAGLREGQEESGLDFGSARCLNLGEFAPDSGILGFKVHLALAMMPGEFPETIPVDLNEVEGYEIWSWFDIEQAVLTGEISDASTVIAVLRTRVLKERGVVGW